MPTTQIVTFSKGDTVFVDTDDALQNLEADVPGTALAAIKDVLLVAEDSGDVTVTFTASDDGKTTTITRSWSDAGWTTYSALASEQATAKAGAEAAGWSVTIS